MTTLAQAAPARALRTATVRLALMGGGALALAATNTTNHIGTICPFKLLTHGVPCPMCGGLRTATDVGRGDLGAALAMSPAILFCSVLLVVSPFGLENRWWKLAWRTRVVALVCLMAFAWVWQLGHDGYLS